MLRKPALSTTTFFLRSIAVLTVSLSQALAAAPGAEVMPAPGKLPCTSQARGYDGGRDIECPLNATGTTQRFRFKANFSGSHDDTVVSMTAALNEAPLVCDKGSKTSLTGEDGDVSLECRFSVAEKADAKQVLKVKLSWSHAQYTDFELLPD